MQFSQNNEQQIILDYFGSHIGYLLDIGANDGVTFSNSRQLLLNGWSGTLVEPVPACVDKLSVLYMSNPYVTILPFAVGAPDCADFTEFHVSGFHLPDRSDDALLSSMLPTERLKWEQRGVQFTTIDVPTLSLAQIFRHITKPVDFVSIDVEGMDLVVLKQLDLTNVKLLCIEHNSDDALLDAMRRYAFCFEMREIYKSGENVIFAK